MSRRQENYPNSHGCNGEDFLNSVLCFQFVRCQKDKKLSISNDCMYHQDSRIAVKACEGLMLCASLPESQAAQCMVRNTQFCTLLAERLCSLYNALPLSMDPVDIESVEAKWG